LSGVGRRASRHPASCPPPDETGGVEQAVGVVEKLEARRKGDDARQPKPDSAAATIDDEAFAQEAITGVERLSPIEANGAALLLPSLGRRLSDARIGHGPNAAQAPALHDGGARRKTHALQHRFLRHAARILSKCAEGRNAKLI
jgi:hypothetical protein